MLREALTWTADLGCCGVYSF